jgi:hypothetical protein
MKNAFRAILDFWLRDKSYEKASAVLDWWSRYGKDDCSVENCRSLEVHGIQGWWDVES